MKLGLQCDINGKYYLPADLIVNQDYGEAIVKYTNILDPIFRKARDINEFDFLFTLWRLRGMSDGGGDPYETSIRTIKDVMQLANSQVDKLEIQINLSLWVYCHILEASEPYEIVTNLLNICQGGRFNPCWYPPVLQKRGGNRIIAPGEKIMKIKTIAKNAGFINLDLMYSEVYDRDIRNAVFHSDYANDKRGLRIMGPGKSIPWDDVRRLITRGIAYFECITNLYRSYISSYTKPIVIPAPPGFSPAKDEMIRIIIREEYGAVGFRTEATNEQITRGKIIARGGRYFADEIKLFEENPTLDILPSRSNG